MEQFSKELKESQSSLRKRSKRPREFIESPGPSDTQTVDPAESALKRPRIEENQDRKWLSENREACEQCQKKLITGDISLEEMITLKKEIYALAKLAQEATKPISKDLSTSWKDLNNSWKNAKVDYKQYEDKKDREGAISGMRRLQIETAEIVKFALDNIEKSDWHEMFKIFVKRIAKSGDREYRLQCYWQRLQEREHEFEQLQTDLEGERKANEDGSREVDVSRKSQLYSQIRTSRQKNEAIGPLIEKDCLKSPSTYLNTLKTEYSEAAKSLDRTQQKTEQLNILSTMIEKLRAIYEEYSKLVESSAGEPMRVEPAQGKEPSAELVRSPAGEPMQVEPAQGKEPSAELVRSPAGEPMQVEPAQGKEPSAELVRSPASVPMEIGFPQSPDQQQEQKREQEQEREQEKEREQQQEREQDFEKNEDNLMISLKSKYNIGHIPQIVQKSAEREFMETLSPIFVSDLRICIESRESYPSSQAEVHNEELNKTSFKRILNSCDALLDYHTKTETDIGEKGKAAEHAMILRREMSKVRLNLTRPDDGILHNARKIINENYTSEMEIQLENLRTRRADKFIQIIRLSYHFANVKGIIDTRIKESSQGRTITKYESIQNACNNILYILNGKYTKDRGFTKDGGFKDIKMLLENLDSLQVEEDSILGLARKEFNKLYTRIGLG